MSSVTAPRPPVQGFHHVSLTVTDLKASVEWYKRLLELQQLSAPFPDYGNQGNDYAIVLIHADAGISIGLHHHDAADGLPFDERQTGLDHPLSCSSLVFRNPDNIQLEFFHLPT